MSKARPMSQSRRQRRSYERILKKLDPAAYKEFKKDAIARGKEIHRQNVQDQLRRQLEDGDIEILGTDAEDKKA